MAETNPDLLESIDRGDTAGLEAALGQGADANAADRWGVPALAEAAARGDLAALRLLLGHGAAVERTSGAGNSALMAAAARGHLEVLRALLEAGADPGHRNRWDQGAEDWAQWSANAAEVRALLHAAGR